MVQDRLKYLFDAYFEGSITPQERIELFLMVEDTSHQESIMDLLGQAWDRTLLRHDLDDQKAAIITSQILSPGKEGFLKRIHLGKYGYWAIAATILVGIMVTFFVIWNQKTAQNNADGMAGAQEEILPGKKGAILTLGNGRQIILDDVKAGLVVNEGGVDIVMDSGILKYAPSIASTQIQNTVTTPMGREYQIQLPDGSRVWLNAGSSITFPTVFDSQIRRVSTRGELFFEIVKLPHFVPFIVTSPLQQIEVLGTKFNVRSYPQDQEGQTVLVEGKVRLGSASTKETRIMAPGEQALLEVGGAIKIQEANLDHTLAWKNGTFDFTDLDFGEVMKQLARWYDVEIVYENGVPDLAFNGKMGRDVNLSHVIGFFEESGIKIRREGSRKLIISQ